LCAVSEDANVDGGRRRKEMGGRRKGKISKKGKSRQSERRANGGFPNGSAGAHRNARAHPEPPEKRMPNQKKSNQKSIHPPPPLILRPAQ
jgi:hypothetical protein